MINLSEKAAQNLSALRKKKPLIQNITNAVAMNYTANALLAMGASPVMAFSGNEVEEMVSLAETLVLNIGTLTEDRLAAIIKAGKKASELKTPVIFDPVGSGATLFRTNSAREIIGKIDIRVIRGNPSEIRSLKHMDSKTKGVESIHSVEDVVDTGKLLAKELRITLAITGKKDLITDGEQIIRVSNGHPLMGYVTGIGCAATAAIGAFLTVDKNSVSAAATALAFFGLAGEIAGKKASAPGSFMIEILDALYTITPEELRKGCKIII